MIVSTPSPIARFLGLVLDSNDPMPLAEFWMAVLGGEIEPANLDENWVGLKNVPVLGYVGIQRVPEGKVVKNRVHIDIEVDDIAAAVEATVSLGARAVGGIVDEITNLLQVMLDPEGNEFCFITRVKS